jgi:hypothetical protein
LANETPWQNQLREPVVGSMRRAQVNEQPKERDVLQDVVQGHRGGDQK